MEITSILELVRLTSKWGAKKFIVPAACLCVVAVVAAALIVPGQTSSSAGSKFPEIGYELSSKVLSEGFNTSSTAIGLSVSNPDRVEYMKSDGGLKVNLKQNSSALYMDKGSTGADSVRCVIDASAVDGSHYLDLKVKFKTKEVSSWYYSVTVRMTPNKVIVIPDVWLGSGTPEYQNLVFMYDVSEKGRLDILVEVRDGNIVVGVDGFDSTLRTDYKVFNDLMFERVTLASNKEKWSSPATVVVERLELGNGGDTVFHDRLHKTITAWGHDFTLALQIHADQANPAQLALMKELSDRYGVRGEFDAWMNTGDIRTEYSVTTSSSYADALSNLRSSGWEIGLHAVTSNPSTRSEIVPLIDQFENMYGPLRSWVDHGNVQQDIWQQGNNPSSPYYISDLLTSGNVMIWVNQEEQSQSKAQDLNLDTVMYHNGSYPGLDLMRVSHYGFLEETNDWQPAYAPVTGDDMSSRQRVYASNSAVLIWHDYTWRYLYVEDGGVNYSVQSHGSMGYPYEPITAKEMSEEGANVHPGGTWKIKPVAEEYFSTMYKDFDVWYATPREVYDRSIAMSSLVMSENETAVTLENRGPTTLDGLTLYTKERPDYCLKSGSTCYYADRGAENWQFVIPELAANSSMVLMKADIPSSAPKVTDNSAHVSMWGDGDVLYLRANRDGAIVLTSNVTTGNGLKLIDLGSGKESAYRDGSAVSLIMGRTYKIVPS